MKGVFVHENIEYRLEMPKDQPQQGDALPCTLTLKNYGSAQKSIGDLVFEIAYGDPKKVKGSGAEFEVIAKAEVGLPWELGPQQQKSLQWTFNLDKNCPVSEKAYTLFFRYGSAAGEVELLPITVKADRIFESVLQILETSFQFVLKGHKASKGWYEAKLKAPSSARYSMVNDLNLAMRFEGETLTMNFKFNVKKFENAEVANSVKIGKGKTLVEKVLEPRQYLLGEHINHQGVEAVLAEALEVVSTNL